MCFKRFTSKRGRFCLNDSLCSYPFEEQLQTIAPLGSTIHLSKTQRYIQSITSIQVLRGV